MGHGHESTCTQCVLNEPQIIVCNNKTYTFDFVYDTYARQDELYDSAINRLVEGFLKGHNATVLAYGQVKY